MIRRLVIAPRDPCDASMREEHLSLLRREFPSVAVEASRVPPPAATRIDAEEWRDPGIELASFDARLGAGESVLALVAARGPVEETALQLLTRFQGLLDRRNEASATRLFERLVERRLEHATDHAHALDVLQWVLRLAPDASLALQLAALFHAPEAPELEPSAPDVDGRGGLRLLFAKLAVPTPAAARASALLARRDAPAGDPERAILDDAAALSFFSRRSDAMLLRDGLGATRRAARLALHRLRPAARPRLLHVRLVPAVWRMVEEALRHEGCGAALG